MNTMTDRLTADKLEATEATPIFGGRPKIVSIAMVVVIFAVGCKKLDEVTSKEEFIPLPLGKAQLGKNFDYVTRNIVKAPLHVAYGLVGCAKYQSDENIAKAIEQALIEMIDIWITPMREVGEVITKKDIRVSHIEKLEKNICRLDVEDKKYHLEAIFVCGEPANEKTCGTMSRALIFDANERDTDKKQGNFSIPPWLYVFDGQRAGDKYVRDNVPAIYIENTSFSKFGLLHEIGHAFGLADTYMMGVEKPGQPPSVMSSTLPFLDAQGELTLAKDDIRGAQWLYNYFHNKGQEQGCLFPDYEASHDSFGGVICTPKNVLLDTIKQALFHTRHGPIERAYQYVNKAVWSHATEDAYVCNATSDNNANSSLHLAVIGGAHSKDLQQEWLSAIEQLAETIADSCPNKFDERNADQNTALQLAEKLKYEEAKKAIVAKKPAL